MTSFTNFHIFLFALWSDLTIHTPFNKIYISFIWKVIAKKLNIRTRHSGSPSTRRLSAAANRKSGNNDGDAVLSMFRRLLNPAQVVDLADRPPEVALEWCSLLGDVRTTVLVAGGDGTVAWVLNTIHKMQLKVRHSHGTRFKKKKNYSGTSYIRP